MKRSYFAGSWKTALLPTKSATESALTAIEITKETYRSSTPLLHRERSSGGVREGVRGINMTKASAKQKGKDLENWVADQIIQKGLDLKAQRSHGSGNGNREKSDIWTSLMVLGQNAGFECKNQMKISIETWWQQAKKLESLGREPILVFKLPYEPLGKSKVVIYLDTFLELVKAANSEKEIEYVTPEQSRDLKYSLHQLITNAKKVIKLVDKEV